MILVIGYGNELRRDDAAGPIAARLVAAWNLPGVEAMTAHGLAPELAEPLSQAERAVFIDAAENGRVEAVLLTPEPAPSLGHSAGPGWLLGLAESTYGRRPPAWLVTVPAEDLGHGEGLTDTARAGVADALGEVRRCMKLA